MRIFFILIIVSLALSHENYKEIRLENFNNSALPFLYNIGIDLDHIHKNGNYIQFAVSDSDLSKIDMYNLTYEIIHENLEEFYASRLTNDYESRDFDLGSMGGYYTLEEICIGF